MTGLRGLLLNVPGPFLHIEGTLGAALWRECVDPRRACAASASRADARQLGKLNRLVGRLCLTAEDIAEDGNQLSLNQWQMIVDDELAMAMANRQLAA